MGEYRTFFEKVTHIDGTLYAHSSKSISLGNARKPSGNSSGNFFPLCTSKKCEWGRREYRNHSLCRYARVQNLQLILLIGASFLLLQVQPSTSLPIDGESLSATKGDDNLIISNAFTTQPTNSIPEIDDVGFPQPRNCSQPSSEEFPVDLFSKEQRQHGAIAVHFFALFYMLYALLLVCDEYFVPAIECICHELQISPNVAGATFMAISTSAPEFFTNVMGTFVTKGDLGVGTIVGSAVFNVLAVGFCVGIGSNVVGKSVVAGGRSTRKGVALEWWSLSRDTVYYLLSVGILIVVLFDGRVYWYEALLMLCVYGFYIAGMCYDARCKEFVEGLFERIQGIFGCGDRDEPKKKLTKILKEKLGTSKDETSHLVTPGSSDKKCYGTGQSPCEKKGPSPGFPLTEVLFVTNDSYDSNSTSSNSSGTSNGSSVPPSGSRKFGLLKDIISFPIRLALRLTVPDCKTEGMKKWWPISLFCCIGWIGGLSYVLSWMVCVIGDTLGIPDSVSGLTVLAAGTSFPEVLSSVIVARQGMGSMGLSNSVGSNTFDILVCLGLPWLSSLILTTNDNDFISIHFSALGYSAILLVTSMIILYIIIVMNGYVLDVKVGVACLLMYLVFITLACLLEMNVFFPVNLPPC